MTIQRQISPDRNSLRCTTAATFLSAQDHIDVFSLSADQFVAPLSASCAGHSEAVHWTGADAGREPFARVGPCLTDRLLSSIPITQPAASRFPIAAATTNSNGCLVGPLYVAAATESASICRDRCASLLRVMRAGWNCLPGKSCLANRFCTLGERSFAVAEETLRHRSDGTIIAFGDESGRIRRGSALTTPPRTSIPIAHRLLRQAHRSPATAMLPRPSGHSLIPAPTWWAHLALPMVEYPGYRAEY